MAIVAASNPRQATTFDIQFRLPQKPEGSATIAATVQVVHSVFTAEQDGFKIGLMFVNLSADAVRAIANFMK